MKGHFRKVLPLLLTLLMVLGAVSVANATDSGASAGGDYTMPTQMEDNAQAGEKEEPEPKAQAEKPDSGANSEKKAAVLKGAKASNDPAYVYIPVSKGMKGNRSPRWQETDSFSFTLNAVEPSDAPMPEESNKCVLTAHNVGDEGYLNGHFDEITFTEPGVYIYSITEDDSTVRLVSNDTGTYYVRVEVYAYGTRLYTSLEYFDKDSAPDVTTPGYYEPNTTFANTYGKTPFKASFPVSKTISGDRDKWIKGESYTFEITPSDTKNPMPAASTVTLTADEDLESPLSGSFGEIEFDKAGTYQYTITEQDTDNPGVAKDSREVKVTVHVYYDSVTGGYSGTVEYPAYDQYGLPDTTFANTYSEPKPAELIITTEKKYNGPAHTFKYGLYTTESTQSGTEGITYPENMKPAGEGAGKLIGGLHDLKKGEISRVRGIKFTKEDTYKFTLKEDRPAIPDGISYDPHDVTVTVDVGYDKTKNEYTAAVTYDNSDKTVTDKAVFTNKYSAEGKVQLNVAKNFVSDIDGWEWPADKSFVFELTGKDGAPIRVKEGGEIVPQEKLTLTIDKDTTGHTAVFREMIYTFDDIADAEGGQKTFEYNLCEDKGGTTVDGITYADDQTVKVTVTDNKDGTLSTSVVYENPGISAAAMKNTYSATGSVTANVQATKDYLDKKGTSKADWGDKTFDLQLIPNGKDEPVPLGADETTHITTKTASQGNPTVSFGVITYTKPGVYTYGIKEKLPEGVDPYNPVDDTTLYDASEHSVTITVEDDGKGGLKEPVVKYANGTQCPVFENRELPDLQVTLHAKKVLTGAVLQDGEFSFELYESDAQGTIGSKVKDATASADGVISGALAYTFKDLFDNLTAKQEVTRYYAAKETKYRDTEITADTASGYTFDTGVKLYRFTAVHEAENTEIYLKGDVEYSTDNGQTWKPLSDTSEPVFSNRYNSEGEGTLLAHKDFESGVYGWKGWTDEEFTFTLTRKDGGKIRVKDGASGTKEVDSLEVKIGKDTVDHTKAFDDIIYNQEDLYDSESKTYLKERDIEYIISETKPATPDGITYASDKPVTVHIRDDGAGKIAVTYTDGTSSGNIPIPLEFRNIYKINDSKTAKFRVSKTLTGRDWNASDEFSFLLEAVTKDAPMPAQGGETVKATSGSKTAEFGQITYDTAGVWRYKITETDAGSAAIIKDSTVKYVTVTVEDGGKGKLKDPVIAYDNDDSVTEADSRVTDSAAFTNRYRATGTAKTSLTKEFVSDVHGWKGWTDEKFTFELTAKDGSDIRVKDGDSTKVVKSIHGTATASEPVVNFADIVYTQADMTQGGAYSAERSFIYKIHEVRPAGDPDNGIVYAEDKYITVTVRDDGSGNLVTTIDYGNESNGNDTSKLVMTNEYVTMDKVHAEIKAKKIFLDENGVEKTDWRTASGGKAKTFDLELVPNGDEPVPPDADKTTRVTKKTAVQNASVVHFGQIEYTEAGVYEYLIREKLPEGVSRENPVHDGILYDPAEHSVKVVVRDDGQGGLEKPEVHFDQDTDDYSGVMPEFVNSELAEGTAYAEMMAGKKISGDSLRNGEFSFTLYESDEKGKITDFGKIETAGNDGDGNVYFTPLIYRYNDIYGDKEPTQKVFYYAVKEDKGDNKGITYDESVKLYRVTVNGDKTEHKLTLTVEYKDGSSWKSLSNENRPVFNNSYDSKGEAQISLNKSLISDEAVWKGWTDQKFSFELTSKDGEKIRTEKDGEYVFVDKLTGTASKDSPEIALKKIVYTRDDLIDKSAADEAESYLDSRTFEYTIREIVPEGAKNNKYKGITYDSAERTVTVTISDNGDGTIKVVYGKDSVTETAPVLSFVNTYSFDDSKTAVIEVSKTLKGRDWKEGDKFSFTLEAMTDGAPMPWIFGRTASVTKSKTQDEFGKITYKEAGTWKYAVREKDSSIKGITTDSTVKYVTVTVADNGDGTLKTPVVTYDNSYAVNPDDAAVKDKAAFTNTYKNGGKGTNTGDSTSIVIELVTAVCAAALLTVMLIRKRREKSSKQ